MKITVSRASFFWGCPGLSFKANLPFNRLRQFFAALLKEIPAALTHCFQQLNCYKVAITVIERWLLTFPIILISFQATFILIIDGEKRSVNDRYSQGQTPT